MILEMFGMMEPWHGFTIDTAWFLVFQRFIKIILDTLKEE